MNDLFSNVFDDEDEVVEKNNECERCDGTGYNFIDFPKTNDQPPCPDCKGTGVHESNEGFRIIKIEIENE